VHETTNATIADNQSLYPEEVDAPHSGGVSSLPARAIAKEHKVSNHHLWTAIQEYQMIPSQPMAKRSPKNVASLESLLAVFVGYIISNRYFIQYYIRF
jgi:hypothetical protein